MKHIDTQTEMGSGLSEPFRTSILPHLILNAMRKLNAENITIWHHIENATVAMQTLIRTLQSAEDGDVEDVEEESLALVTAYDRLIQKVAAKQIKNEEMKNESL